MLTYIIRQRRDDLSTFQARTGRLLAYPVLSINEHLGDASIQTDRINSVCPGTTNILDHLMSFLVETVTIFCEQRTSALKRSPPANGLTLLKIKSVAIRHKRSRFSLTFAETHLTSDPGLIHCKAITTILLTPVTSQIYLILTNKTLEHVFFCSL